MRVSRDLNQSAIQNWKCKVGSTNYTCVYKESVPHKSPMSECPWCIKKEAYLGIRNWENEGSSKLDPGGPQVRMRTVDSLLDMIAAIRGFQERESNMAKFVF